MPRSTDTYARAYEACAEVFTELARFPTIDLIRERVGINSPVTIKRAITDWTLAFAESHREKLTRPDLPQALLDGAETLWKLALRSADQRFDTERQAWAQEKAEIEKELSELQIAHHALHEQWENLQASTVTTLAASAAQIRELEERLQDQHEKLSGAETACTDTQSELDRIRAVSEMERRQFAERVRDWEARFDADHHWHLQRIDEERTLTQSAIQRDLAERDTRISRLSLENEKLQAQLRANLDQIAELRGRSGALEESSDLLRKALAAREQELDGVRAELLGLKHRQSSGTRQARPKTGAKTASRKRDDREPQ